MLSLYTRYVVAKMQWGRRLHSFCGSEGGATAIEYGLIVALIALAVIGGATAVGTNLNSKFNSIANAVQ